jgi:hypothetical protein
MEQSTNPSTTPEQAEEPRRYTRTELGALFHAYNPDITLDEVIRRVISFGSYKETYPGSDLYEEVSFEEFVTQYGISRAGHPATSPDESKGKQRDTKD